MYCLYKNFFEQNGPSKRENKTTKASELHSCCLTTDTLYRFEMSL